MSRVRSWSALSTLALAWSVGTADPSDAACTLTRSAEGEYIRHLGRDCTPEQRDAQAVPAGELLAALQGGHGVDLAGVTVAGELNLDKLPEGTLTEEERGSPELRDLLAKTPSLRVIGGPITIRESVVRGVIKTNLKDGYLVIRGPVTIAGTTFEQPVDLSRTIFLGPVDATNAVFQREAFFIMARFEQPAQFVKTAFGPHSRFHKARFAQSASFVGAGFNGLAEFIQVSFSKEASFARALFKMGTGFSGSRFGGPLDFSEAVFERAVFFTYAVFEGDAYFRRATFRAEANFSDAEFKGVDDFSKAFFNTEPRFARVKANPDRSLSGLQDPWLLYTIAGTMFVFAVVFVFLLRKR
jgi:hypothetical protein